MYNPRLFYFNLIADAIKFVKCSPTNKLRNTPIINCISPCFEKKNLGVCVLTWFRKQMLCYKYSQNI